MMADKPAGTGVIHIARAGGADRAVLMDLARLDHAESAFGDLPFSERKFSALFDKSTSQPGRCITLKATVKGAIVGSLYCTIGEYFIAENNIQANVHVVYVRQDVRRTMLGGRVAVRLVRAATQWAKAQGAQHVLFYVTSGSGVARTDAFFRKMGMTTLGGNYAIRV